MIHIDNLLEKELLIAHYFCDLRKKEFSRTEVFDMWSNWFKKDFKINNQSVFCIVDDELVYKKHIKKQDEKIRENYNHTFQNIYKYIEKLMNDESHDRAYFKDELKRLRNKLYGRVIGLAKPLGFYLAMNNSFHKLAEFKILNYGEKGHIITSGDYDKMIRYLQNIKNERAKDNK